MTSKLVIGWFQYAVTSCSVESVSWLIKITFNSNLRYSESAKIKTNSCTDIRLESKLSPQSESESWHRDSESSLPL